MKGDYPVELAALADDRPRLKGESGRPVPSLSTKARTLASLDGWLENADLLDQVAFSVGDWRRFRNAVISRFGSKLWSTGPLAVRSSARLEDLRGGADAGKFLSVVGITGQAALAQAVEDVIASYGPESYDDEVLVQPYVSDAIAAGVAVTRDASTGARCYVVNYSPGRDTAAITSGRAELHTTFIHRKHSAFRPDGLVGRVILLCHELEHLFGRDDLDVEFALSAADRLILLQVRTLTLAEGMDEESEACLSRLVASKVSKMRDPDPFLLGSYTMYGVMPDWNPAEMIGERPRPLSFDLYRYLITDDVWARQRYDYGYRDVRGQPLIRDIGGQPFIDLRLCFNSFVPGSLPNRTAGRLVESYLDRLFERPELHDRVEFEVALTAFAFDFDDRIRELDCCQFGPWELGEIRHALLETTKNCLDSEKFHRREQARLAAMTERRIALHRSMKSPLDKARGLLWVARELGARAFAGLARIDFVAQALLGSMVRIGIIEPADREDIIKSAGSIGSDLGVDLARLDQSSFLRKYGHLRPGTYDIRSLRYDAAPDHYFDFGKTPSAPDFQAERPLDKRQTRTLSKLTRDCGLEFGERGLIRRIKQAIRARDYAKFVFTAAVSDALDQLAQVGELANITAEDLSYCRLSSIMELDEHPDLNFALAQAVEEGKRKYANTCGHVLPPLIRTPQEVESFKLPAVHPTFVTARRVVAPVRSAENPAEVEGSIVAIRSADPGYDWLFSRGIAGFVTAYGGVNSHMALRASALGIPAVIGAGEAMFTAWSRAARLEIDCASRRVRPL